MSEPYPPAAQPVPPVTPLLPEPAQASVGRGALLALLTVPVGVVVWVLVWSMGFIASIVGAGVAYLALWLYLRGAGWVTRAGAMVVLGITAVTLLLAFFGGIVFDAATTFGEWSELGTWGAFTHAEFWPAFLDVLPEAMPEYLPDLAWALAFGALGSFATLRSAFAAAATPLPPTMPAGFDETSVAGSGEPSAPQGPVTPA